MANAKMQFQNKKQVILNCEQMETRFALINNGQLEEYQIERNQTDEVQAGSIIIGKIVNLEPSLQAAFVDIDAEKNAFLHYWDMIPASYEMEKIKQKNAQDKKITEEIKEKKKSSSFSDKVRSLLKTKSNNNNEIRKKINFRHRKKITTKDIPEMFPPGTEILVQVVKSPIGTKGARVTTNVSLPGRYLVLLPYSDHVCMSSKIESKKERDRLKKIIHEFDIPEGMGLICRTVSEGRKKVFLQRDLDILLNYWHDVELKLDDHQVPCVVYQAPNLLEKTIRDFMTEDIDEIIVDDVKSYKFLSESIKKFIGKTRNQQVKLYNRAKPIFQHYKVKDQILGIYRRKVKLPSGGYLCFDETEALVAIDVNSGTNRNHKNQQNTILTTNLEAAHEVARQLRLRNVGGLVIIDFIDMRAGKDRETVNKAMRRLLGNDRAKSKMLPISKLGLMEMTRQREHESIREIVFSPCPYCNGTGKVMSTYSMSVEIQRYLQTLMKKIGKQKEEIALRVILHPAVLTRLKNEDASFIENLEIEYGSSLTFRADESLHHDAFEIVDPTTGLPL
ncbi:Rne/Rng family ribonuclease [Lentisphaerota bacterium WC36G]|nr:Rne/Rng family ribonuclease [Lentisphaerae bacterium WC36]